MTRNNYSYWSGLIHIGGGVISFITFLISSDGESTISSLLLELSTPQSFLSVQFRLVTGGGMVQSSFSLVVRE